VGEGHTGLDVVGGAGKMELEPIIWTPFLYVYLFFGGAAFSCWVMRVAGRRWSEMRNVGLILCACAAGMLVDFVAEGLLILPAGCTPTRAGTSRSSARRTTSTR
jgi:hypothetical protein